MALYEVSHHPFGGVIGDALTQVADFGAPLAVLALLAWLIRDSVRRRGSWRVAPQRGLSVRRTDVGHDLIGRPELTA